MRRCCWTGQAAAAVVAASVGCAASADEANFDSFATEGFVGSTLTTGGITFSTMDRRFPGQPPGGEFAIENATNDLTGRAGYSSPNCLGFSGYSPGPGTGFARLGSFEMQPSAVSTSATIEVFDLNSNPAGTTMNLEALRNGGVVGSVSVPAQAGFSIHHTTLSYNGAAFDRMRFFVGPGATDVMFIVIDNVTMSGSAPCAADYDHNGSIEPADISLFVNVWYTSLTQGTLAGDFDGDGSVAPSDIALFVARWLAALSGTC